MKLCRSWMFVPGNHERRLAKVPNLEADIIIYDLEDAVPLHEKEKARTMVREAVNTYRDKVSFVRVNDASTSFFQDDVNSVAGEGIAGIVLPKAAGGEQLRLADDLLRQAEERTGLEKGSLEIVPLIESAAGVFRAFEIATTSRRVKRLAFGSVDYTLDIGAVLSKEGTETLYARSHLVVVSRAANLEPPIDSVYIHVKDPEVFLKDARLARQLGFGGKLVIHPDQALAANDVFSPTQEEVEEAKAIQAAFEDALAKGVAAIQLNGKLIDYPVAIRAQIIVEQAKVLGRL